MKLLIAPLIIGLIAGIGAVFSFCSAARETARIDRLGSALPLEAAPVGSRVRFEGQLLESGDPVRHPPAPKRRRCVASYAEVVMVTETQSTDSDGNTTTNHHEYDLFRSVRGPSQLIVGGRGRKVAVPLRYWTEFLGRRERQINRFPRWLGDNYRVDSYAGSIDYFAVKDLCLEAGDTLFVAGAVASVYDGSAGEASAGGPPPEMRDPIVVLRPAGGPIEVWPGTEESRLASLRRARSRKRVIGGILAAVAALAGVLTLGGALVIVRRA